MLSAAPIHRYPVGSRQCLCGAETVPEPRARDRRKSPRFISRLRSRDLSPMALDYVAGYTSPTSFRAARSR